MAQGSSSQSAKRKGKSTIDHAPKELIDNVKPHAGFPDTSPKSPSKQETSFIRQSPSGLEGPRKLFHSSVGFLVMALWYLHTPIIWCIYILSAGLAAITIADIWRFNSPWFARQYEMRLGVLMRKSEHNKINGVIWYILGVLSCLIFFPRDLAVLSIIILSWCDTSASIFGRLFGRYTPPLPFHGKLFAPRKSLAGSLAAALTGGIAAYIFYQYLGEAGSEGDLSWIGNSAKDQAWSKLFISGNSRVEKPTRLPQLPSPRSEIPLGQLCIVTGISAALAEAIEIWGLDDNLTMPGLAGLLIWSSLMLLKP